MGKQGSLKMGKLIFFLSFILSNVEVPQFINASIFVRSNHSEPVPHIVLLQVLLSQVLEVPFGEVAVGSNNDFGLLTYDGDGVAESTGLATNLNPLLKELLERRNVHDLVLHRLRAVNGECRTLLLVLRSSCTSSTHFFSHFLLRIS
uniref:Uncharacterized protein n=1 Tax=Glycine max TaxID=3847 RepID=C6SYJ5_SOYBN|nr:unknown [Glycine max]